MLRGIIDNFAKELQNNIQKEIGAAQTSITQDLTFDAFKPAQLTDAMKEQFFRDGYLIIPNAVPEKLRNRSLRAINRSIGRGPDALPANSPFKLIPKLVSSCPELMLSDEICDLMRLTPVLQSAHALIGTKTYRTWGGQIALRFPGDLCVPSEKLKQYDGPIAQFFVKKGLESMQSYQKQTAGAQFVNPDFQDEEFVPIPTWQERWHVDGWPNPLFKSKAGDNGVENFTMLVGVYLSDANENLMGNLTVFPGSHRILEKGIRDAGGPEKLFHRDQSIETPDDPQTESLKNLKARVQLGTPVQLKVNAGDVVLAHYQLAHCIAPNISPNIRYAIYFRLNGENHPPQTYRAETLTNIWLDYKGMTSIVQRLQPSAAQQQSGVLALSSDPRMPQVQSYFEQAIAEDRKKQFDNALSLYEKGLVIVLDIIKKESNPQKSAQLKEFAGKYMNRAEQIKTLLNSNPFDG